MPAPDRRDAITMLVFVGAGVISLVLAAIGLWIVEWLVGDLQAVVEAITTTTLVLSGGAFAASRYRKGGD